MRCLAPPLGQRATCRSKAYGDPAGKPHWGQEGERSLGEMSPNDGAPQIRRIVVRANGVDALRPMGMSEMSTVTLPRPK